MSEVFERFPPHTHPRLYPKPLEYYQAKRKKYKLFNLLLAVCGVIALLALMAVPHHYDIDNTVAFVYFFAQAAPLIWLDLSLRNELRTMRKLDTRSTRRAELNPRRLFDVMSPRLFWSAVAVYVGFWVFTTWFRQFGYDWFGGYLNNIIITVMNLFFAAMMFWRMTGKRLNPHITEADRLVHLRQLGWVLGLVSIAVTLFAVLTISLSAAEAREFRPFAVSIYYQMLALISMQAYRLDTSNFDVYRKNGDVAAT